MIYKFKRIAVAIQVLRLPCLSLGLISLAALIVIILFFPSDQDTRLIIPSIVGFLWGMGTYSFIVTFRSAPDNPSRPLSIFGKIKHAYTRAWYWFISLTLLFGTVSIIIITIRMILIWLRE
jgi:hypothetical protein